MIHVNRTFSLRDVVGSWRPTDLNNPNGRGRLHKPAALSTAYFEVKNVRSTFPFSPKRHTKRSGVVVLPLRAM